MRSPRSQVFAVPAVLLLLATGLGCGTSKGEATTVSTRRAAGPAQLATQIDRSQTVIDGGSRSGLKRAAVAQQLAFRELAEHRALRRATLVRLTPAARSAATAALHAAAALSKIVPAERRFPDWRIVAPPPPTELRGYFESAARAHEVPWQYLAAIELVETRMGRIRGLSPKGAKGPMQFLPTTWAEYGHGSIDSQHDSIMAAARFLEDNGARSNIGRALLHYNPSPAYVAAVESYAKEMHEDRHTFFGFYHWQVLYQTTKGTFLLPVGYPRRRPRRLSR